MLLILKPKKVKINIKTNLVLVSKKFLAKENLLVFSNETKTERKIDANNAIGIDMLNHLKKTIKS